MNPLEVLQLVVSKLDTLEVPFMVGGSFASSIYGFARTTRDADLIVVLKPDQVGAFADLFAKEFYVDRSYIEQGLAKASAFNIIHFESSFKVDFFPLKNRSFDRAAFARRRVRELDPESKLKTYVQTAEDTILSKLEWYRMGAEVSENQWKDVLGILKAQGPGIDQAYLRKWAGELGVADLLNRAMKGAGLTFPS